MLEQNPIYILPPLENTVSNSKKRLSCYTYGFNGQEEDSEIKGEGNSYDFGARMYDPRLGKFFAIDPKADIYPFMSPYCYAANNPIYYTDENGEGPKPAKHTWVRWIVHKAGHLSLEAILSSNNTSLRELERWALSEAGFDKSTAWKIKGAIGEGLLAYHLVTTHANGAGDRFQVAFQERTTANNNSTPDVVARVSVSCYAYSLRGVAVYNYKDYEGEFNYVDGSQWIELYREDTKRPGGGGLLTAITYDVETYEFQYEVKTLNPNNKLKSNIKALSRGIDQIEARVADSDAANPIGVLTTDRDAYMRIYNAAQAGDKRAKQFINKLEVYIDNGGRLMLMDGLNEQANRTTYWLRDQIRTKDGASKTEQPAAKF